MENLEQKTRNIEFDCGLLSGGISRLTLVITSFILDSIQLQTSSNSAPEAQAIALEVLRIFSLW